MLAVVAQKYGAPDDLKVLSVPKPTVARNGVLVKVHAAGLTKGDWHLMTGTPFVARAVLGLFAPKFKIFGSEIAGVVVAIGEDVKTLKVGDEVFGDLSADGFGGFAEFACAPETAFLLKPARLNFVESAALPTSAMTALQALVHVGELGKGQRLLVIGASGGVGSFAVQIGRALGAQVSAVCSTRNIDLVKSLGAVRVYDYTQEDFTRANEQYDVIVDCAVTRKVSEMQRVLAPTGKYVLVGGERLFVNLAFGSCAVRKGQSVLLVNHPPNQKDLGTIREMVDAGQISPVIDRTLKLEQVPDALKLYMSKGSMQGKVVFAVV